MHFGFMNVLLFHSGHQYASATHVAIFREVSSEPFTVQAISSLTGLDYDSQHVCSVYIIQRHYTTNFNF